MSLGIVFGFSAAFFQSVSYLGSKIFVKKHANDVVMLFALSHIIMAVVSIPLAIFLMPHPMPAFSTYAASLFGCAGFYLFGQLFLFSALARSDPSRVSSLLGLKIFILALITFIFLHQHLTVTKWIAVLLSTYAAFLLSNSGKKLSLTSLILVVMACFSYCLSDLSIKVLVDKFRYTGVFRGAVFGYALCYMLCGVFSVIILFFKPKKPTMESWVYAMPFAISWLIGAIFLFASFAMIGVVFGNIIQSTRGIISIVFGYLIAGIGLETLETKISKMVLVQRIAAAVLMTFSIGLFYYGK